MDYETVLKEIFIEDVFRIVWDYVLKPSNIVSQSILKIRIGESICGYVSNKYRFFLLGDWREPDNISESISWSPKIIPEGGLRMEDTREYVIEVKK